MWHPTAREVQEEVRREGKEQPGALPCRELPLGGGVLPDKRSGSQQLTRSLGFSCALKEQRISEQARQPLAAGTGREKVVVRGGREGSGVPCSEIPTHSREAPDATQVMDEEDEARPRPRGDTAVGKGGRLLYAVRSKFGQWKGVPPTPMPRPQGCDVLYTGGGGWPGQLSVTCVFRAASPLLPNV